MLSTNMMRAPVLLLPLCLLLLGTGCPSGGEDPLSDAGASDGGGGDAGPPQLRCTDPQRSACEDTMYLELNFQTTTSPGTLVNTDDGQGGFQTMVDATAGGFMANPPQSYVYARFTKTGLEKVAISDDEATLSMDWDIALRRYVVRLNSGDSGPSCVDAASLPETTLYGEVTTLPSAVSWGGDVFYDNACVMIDDGSGLPSSPGTALSGYYSYTGCVAMTGQVSLIQLRDGGVVKLQVESYYDPDKQAACDSAGTTPTPPTGSGHLGLHWAYLP